MTKFKIKNKELRIKGFTLVEMLLAIAIFTVIGTTVLSILFTTLRLSKKSEVQLELKQNGNIAMEQIKKQIRYAKSLDNLTVPTQCPPTPTPPPALSSITITSGSDNAQSTFSCQDINLADAIASNGASIVDLNAVVVTNCSFTCTQATLNDPPTINFKFTLSKPAGSISEASGSVSFQTSVTMRNYTK